VTGLTPQSYTFTHNGTALDHRMEQYRSNYDPAGNLMLDPQSSVNYTYDDENRVIKGVQSGATIAQYWYDAEGQRIRKISAAGTEEYVYDPQGHQIGEMQSNGTFNRIELYAGSRHLATYDQVPQQTIFVHNDWQGTERARSKYDGTSYETCSNLPFGDSQSCTVVGGAADPSPLHYTGKVRDVETNLDYFGARYYASGMAHWMSPDWADTPTSVPYANFGDPQTLNLYAFVSGNPVSHQDSDGHFITLAESNGSDYSNAGPTGDLAPADESGMAPFAFVNTSNLQKAEAETAEDFEQAAERSAAAADAAWMNAAQQQSGSSTPSKPVSAKGQKEIDTAYQLACSHSADGCSSGQQATIRYVGFTYNVQIAGDVMDPSTLPADSIEDPGITNKIFHKGAPDSFYLSSPLGLAGTNVPHVVDDPAGIEAHVDHFGPANPIHWGEAILSLFINTRSQAGGGFTQTCSPGGGCQ
jgi:RHS repeat-associated protein